MADTTKTATPAKPVKAAFNPKGRQGLQILAFAPDWTYANIRVALKALPGMARNKALGNLHRWYLARQLLYIGTIMNGINYMMSGHFLWDNEDPTRVDMGDGRTMVFSKQAMEPLHWITEPGKTALNKMGILPKQVMEQLSNKQWLTGSGAPPIRQADDSLLSQIADTAKHTGKMAVPIAVQQTAQYGPVAGLAGFVGHPIYGESEEEQRRNKRRERKRQRRQRR